MVRGKKIRDSCGICLYPNDKTFDKCPEILNVNTRAVPGYEPSVISLQAVGIKRSINCSFGDNGRYVLVTRENDLRGGFPVPHDNFLKSINSFAPCCESYFYFLLIEALTSRYSN